MLRRFWKWWKHHHDWKVIESGTLAETTFVKGQALFTEHFPVEVMHCQGCGRDTAFIFRPEGREWIDPKYAMAIAKQEKTQ